MGYAAGPGRDDLSSARRGAAAFLDNLSVQHDHGAMGRRNLVTRWTKLGNDHYIQGELHIGKGAFNEATDAWLCALTAFEVARRLVDGGDPQREDLCAKIEGGIQKLELSLSRKVERVRLAFCDHAEILAYYLPAANLDSPGPAVICISMEEEAGAMLLGRLLPEIIGRDLSVLVISYDDVSNCSWGQSEALLSHCLDYLSGRPETDGTRIGVYGEGLSAALATEFAASDRRVAAAVCDGGLWNWARIAASVDWMTGAADAAVSDNVLLARRSQLVRQMSCPVLVVAGGRGIVGLSEAIKLQAECLAARIELDLASPRIIRSPGDEIENFVTSDECIFEWLEHKLA